MEISRRHACVVICLLALIAAGCSSGAEPVASSSGATVAPVMTATATPQPTAVPESTDVTTPSSTQPAGPEPVYRGVLQEQHCAVAGVAPDMLNVHTGPSADNPIVTTLVDTQCRIYLTEGEDSDWYEVTIDLDDKDIRGWVSQAAIAPLRAVIDPDAPQVVLTISIEYELDFPSSEAPIDTFRLVDADGLVVGFLDRSGQIAVPARFPVAQARIEAEWVDDPFCAWTGELSFEGADGRYTSLLEAICA